ncbi:Probable inorganic polyphosphate/ATP-NAD kinase [Anaerococcus octavius]|uniref:NAD kinase n=1 Tax=Anaerococcus octavius TaxID=54007 RepID=A0A380WTC4_9FIRM|nr:NAD(+)/NADH kinase [Anaerococcus octavius]SUU92215.1 Probable inorganic polyphosphate/ATP-NAD kinase [Anaerococcus octavius]
MTNVINIFKNRSKFSKSIFYKTKQLLEKHGYVVSNSYDKNAVLNLVIGGDGTFLKAVHDTNFTSIPFIGINTGHLGFYQEVEVNEIEDFILAFKNDQYQMQELTILQSTVNKRKIESLNEVVVKSNKNQIVRLKVFIDGNFVENFSGDGLIIATPHGSTAYNLSCGGSILHQSLKGYSLTPIAPIYSNLNNAIISPIVLPEDASIDIVVSKRDNYHTVFIFDGKEYSTKDYKINIKVSKNTIKKLILDKNHYWSNIKNKLI